MQSRYAGKRLRAKDIAALPPGVHEDGGGLRLVVEPPRGKQPGARRWGPARHHRRATTVAWVPTYWCTWTRPAMPPQISAEPHARAET
jgi:hypothetical protein